MSLFNNVYCVDLTAIFQLIQSFICDNKINKVLFFISKNLRDYVKICISNFLEKMAAAPRIMVRLAHMPRLHSKLFCCTCSSRTLSTSTQYSQKVKQVPSPPCYTYVYSAFNKEVRGITCYQGRIQEFVQGGGA